MSEALLSEFTKFLTDSGKSNSTIIAYKKDLQQLLEHLQTDLSQVNSALLQKSIKDLQLKHEFTPKTVSRKINSFRTFYRYLLETSVINTNPAEAIEHPRFTAKKPRVLSQIEYLALREVSRSNERLYTMIELLLQTGIRIGELSRIKVKHVNLANPNNHIHVEAFSTVNQRQVPLNSKVQKVIEQFISKQKANPEYPLFSTRDGNHIIIRNIRSSIDRAMVKAGIENACVNDLRNTFIIAQLQAGLPLDYLAQIVGHRSKSTTQKYLELMPSKYVASGELKVAEL
jgi:site-specific recombinase XerD